MLPDEFHRARREFENQANSQKNAYNDEDGGENGKKDAHKRKHLSLHFAHRSVFFIAHLPEKSNLTHRQPLMDEQNRPERQFKATCVASARMFVASNYIILYG